MKKCGYCGTALDPALRTSLNSIASDAIGAENLKKLHAKGLLGIEAETVAAMLKMLEAAPWPRTVGVERYEEWYEKLHPVWSELNWVYREYTMARG